MSAFLFGIWTVVVMVASVYVGYLFAKEGGMKLPDYTDETIGALGELAEISTQMTMLAEELDSCLGSLEYYTLPSERAKHVL